MTTELAPVLSRMLVADEIPPMLAAWLGAKSRRTTQEYLKSLGVFAAFVGAASPVDALAQFFGGTRGGAARTAESWKASMVNAGLSSATVNLRLAVLRSAAKAARRYEVVEWALDVDDVPHEARRDARGPTADELARMIAATTSLRDRAVLHLLGDRGLRRAEAASIELADFDGSSVRVVCKGRREKEKKSLNPATAAALAAWIAERGKEPGPLFGVSGDMIYEIVAAAGKRVGVAARPHGLRHSAAVRALDATNGDVRRVAAFMGHRDVAVTMKYDDERANHEGAVAALVGAP